MSNNICGRSNLNNNDVASLRKEFNTIRTSLCYVSGNFIPLPSQTGQNGKFLSTDGTSLSWSTNGAGDVMKVGTPVNNQLGVWTGDGTIEGDVALLFSSGSLSVGLAGSTLGSLLLAGNTSGTITIKGQAAAGTYNFNLPTTAGTSGQVLTSAGGVSSPMTWTTPTTGTITGTGTTNYVSKWTSSTAHGNSQIFDNATYVGVGTAIPTTKLHSSTSATSSSISDVISTGSILAENGIVGSVLSVNATNFPLIQGIITSTGAARALLLNPYGESVGIGVDAVPVAKLQVKSADAGLILLVSGTTKGLRIGTEAANSIIQGVDTTGSGSYQPLVIGGSTLSLQTAGTTDAITIDASQNVGVTGNFSLSSAGKSFNITEGSNSRVGQTTLVSGTKAITITGLTTSSRAFVQLVAPSGATLTVNYQAVCTANTLTITGNLAATTINTADSSVLNYFVIN